VFTVDAATGRLAHRQSRPSEGRTPRFFALHPDGSALYVLNEDSEAIAVIAVAGDGTRGPTLAQLACGSPVCVVFGG
jgi:6-phosphogluconolactonase